MDCCTQVSRDRLQISRSIRRAGRSWARAGRRSGRFTRVYTAMPIPDTYWEITVAMAAPATPQGMTSTKNRSRPMFSTALTAKNTRGTVELPMDRSRQEKKL